MDIVTHTTSGMAAATVIAAQSNLSLPKKLGLVLLGGLAGAFPDLDVISAWSGFDNSIGKWLNLAPGREIYSGRYWYSHHAFLHSLSAAILFALLVTWISKKLGNVSYTKTVFWAVFCAYNAHLIGDLPTPGSFIGGIRYWFPFKTYIGGWGVVWWWNNYDIQLVIWTVILINCMSMIAYQFAPKRWLKRNAILVFALGFGLIIQLINHRNHDYEYQWGEGATVTYKMQEEHSKQHQKNLLGPKLYHIMEAIDKKMPFAY